MPITLGPDQLFQTPDKSLFGSTIGDGAPLFRRLFVEPDTSDVALTEFQTFQLFDQLLTSPLGTTFGMTGTMPNHRFDRVPITRRQMVGALNGQVPYLAHKTFQYGYNTQLATAATGTTIGASTAYTSETRTIYVPETAERVFESVHLAVTFRTVFSVTNTLSAVQIVFQLGSAGTFTFNTPVTATVSTSRNGFYELDVDLTAYFNQNFGSGGNQTSNFTLKVATASAANINGATFKLIGTYAFDPNVSNTRLRTMRIPIQSMSTSLTATEAEIGIDGINPAPSGQIPALDSFFPESSKVYREIYLEMYGNDGGAQGTNFTPQLQIDATAEVARAPIDTTLVCGVEWRDNYDLTGLITTNATHIWSMRGDTSVSGKMSNVGAILVVTFEYDHGATVIGGTASYELLVALVNSTNQLGQGAFYDGFNLNGQVPYNAARWLARFEINEPGAIAMLQSGVVTYNTIAGSTTAFTKRMGQQSLFRSWTPTLISEGSAPVIQRGDLTGVGWMLKAGYNALSMDVYSTLRTWQAHGYAIINYTAGIQSDIDYGTHTVNYIGHIADSVAAAGIDSPPNHAYLKTPNFGTFFKILSAMAEISVDVTTAQFAFGFGVQQLDGECDETVGFSWGTTTGQFGSVFVVFVDFSQMLNKDSLHQGAVDITKARRFVASENDIVATYGWTTWITYHQMEFNVAGSVTINGLNPPDGSVVQIYATNLGATAPQLQADFVTTAETFGGGFSTNVTDATRSYFAVYNDGTNVGCSAPGTPGIGFFAITIGASGSGGVSRSRVVNQGGL